LLIILGAPPPPPPHVTLAAVGTQAQFTEKGTGTFAMSSFGEGNRLVISQSVATGPSGMYGITGDFFLQGQGTVSGVAVSKNGGRDYQVMRTTPFQNAPSAYPRYGAFPSENVWYVSCGTWAASKAKRDGEIELSKLISVNEKTKQFSFRNETLAPASTYAGEILKTTDGGATFTSVHTILGSDYFNGIHCATEDVCMVVAEGSSGSGSVWGTKNGGESWERLLQDPEAGPGVGLFDVKMLSESEAWAVGGNLAYAGFEARMWHTTDGGATWEVEKVPRVYASYISMPSSTVGYATAMTIDSASSLLAYGI
jgi:hypothetical protein